MNHDQRDHLSKVLSDLVDLYVPVLQTISDEEAGYRPQTDKWSAKEILGHLIDSACNNHRRFVTAVGKDNLVFDGYDQEAWVSIQDYRAMRWDLLVHMWYYYNTLLAHVVGSLPSEKLQHSTKNHNLDRIAFKTVARGHTTTLGYLISDYSVHLKHHLDQIIKHREKSTN